MTLSPQDTADDLRAAAGHIRTGWTRFQLFEDPDRGQPAKVCALGAMMLVDGQFLTFTDRVQSMIDALAPLVPTPLPTAISMPNPDAWTNRNRVIQFNDYGCQGGEELALLFDQAAEKIEADL